MAAKWFRRGRDDRPAGRPPAGRPRPRGPSRPPRESDWRSYDGVAEEYERVHAPYTAPVAADLLALADVGPGARVLAVGTGTARGLEPAADLVGATGIAVGIDPAPGMLAVARRVRPAIPVAAADVLDLPFRDESFDAVVANFALPYFTKLETALFDILRVLRPGGRLVASAWTGHEDEFSRTWRNLVEEAVGLGVLRSGIKDEAPWAEMLSDRKRFEGALRDVRMRPVSVELRHYRFEIPREDYVVGLETEAMGRFARHMLGPALWDRFRGRVREAFAAKFPEVMVDLRDALLAVGVKPR